jgi:hypothetical protein
MRQFFELWRRAKANGVLDRIKNYDQAWDKDNK